MAYEGCDDEYRDNWNGEICVGCELIVPPTKAELKAIQVES